MRKRRYYIVSFYDKNDVQRDFDRIRTTSPSAVLHSYKVIMHDPVQNRIRKELWNDTGVAYVACHDGVYSRTQNEFIKTTTEWIFRIDDFIKLCEKDVSYVSKTHR